LLPSKWGRHELLAADGSSCGLFPMLSTSVNVEHRVSFSDQPVCRRGTVGPSLISCPLPSFPPRGRSWIGRCSPPPFPHPPRPIGRQTAAGGWPNNEEGEGDQSSQQGPLLIDVSEQVASFHKRPCLGPLAPSRAFGPHKLAASCLSAGG
jgi:hypothetical protein